MILPPNPLDATPIGLPLRIVGFFKKIPAWVYILIAVAIAAGVLAHLHSNAVKSFGDQRFQDGVNAEKAAVASAQARANARATKINTSLRTTNDEENRTIARSADDVRLRGPGKAVCPGLAAAPRAASGHVAAGGAANAPVDQLPDPERPALITLPFADTIAFAEQHDRCRAESLTWRESDRQQSAQPQE